MRRLLPALLLAVALLLAAAPASAQTTVPPPSTTLPVADQDAFGALPGANSGRAPQHAGDRGGAMQTVVFLLVLGGMATVFVVIARSTARRTRAVTAGIDPDGGRRP